MPSPHSIQDCEHSVHAAQNAANQHVQQFQQRLQRCTVRCQDEAQETLPSSPSDAQLQKARVRYNEAHSGSFLSVYLFECIPF